MNTKVLDLLAAVATPALENETALSRGRLFHEQETPRRIQARMIAERLDAAHKMVSGSIRGPIVDTDPPRRRPVRCPLILQHLTQTPPYHDTEQAD